MRVAHPAKPSRGTPARPTVELCLGPEVPIRAFNWVVYFDADPDLGWGDAAEVIDVIRRAGAEVVLLTPGSRETTKH
jgi:hypothetical protein